MSVKFSISNYFKKTNVENTNNCESIFDRVFFFKGIQVWQNVHTIDTTVCEKIQNCNFSSEMFKYRYFLGDIAPLQA